jgi:hypothetical protein
MNTSSAMGDLALRIVPDGLAPTRGFAAAERAGPQAPLDEVEIGQATALALIALSPTAGVIPPATGLVRVVHDGGGEEAEAGEDAEPDHSAGGEQLPVLAGREPDRGEYAQEEDAEYEEERRERVELLDDHW